VPCTSCSQGLPLADLLCHRCLQARPNSNAILLTTEVTTPAYYKGKDKHRQVTNMIFRTGVAAGWGPLIVCRCCNADSSLQMGSCVHALPSRVALLQAAGQRAGTFDWEGEQVQGRYYRLNECMYLR